MQLAKLLDTKGMPCVGRVTEEGIELLDLRAGSFASLAALLAADDVLAAAAALPVTGETVS
ncbi:MAG: hypothetical protein KDA45_00565, partial [Planctomycetales bacterium]|nr:hypothetical protein [Planctomycetales bacterium]